MNWLRLAVLVPSLAWVTAVCTVSGCGTTPSSSGPVITGGAPGTPCNPQYNSQGCFYGKKTGCAQPEDGSSPVWVDLGDCPAGEYCTQEPDPTDPLKRVAVCKGFGGSDATAADGLASDATPVDDSSGDDDSGTTDEADGSDNDGQPDDAGEDASGEDVPLPEGCGNGVCDIGENSATCPLDCKPPAKCGDAKCEGSETTSCLLDCAPWTTASLTCANSQCNSAWSACLKDAKCKNYFNCAATCKCSKGCLALCSKGLENHAPLNAVQSCIAQQGCPDPCPTPQCGDGQCMGEEDNGSCPEDCPEHPCDVACGGQAPSGCSCTVGCGASNDCCNMAGEQAAKSCVGSTCGQCK